MAADKFLNSLRRHRYFNNIKVYFIVVKSLLYSSENGGGKCIPASNIIAEVKQAIILGQPEQKWTISRIREFLTKIVSPSAEQFMNPT